MIFQDYILCPSVAVIFLWISLMLSLLIHELGHLIGWKGSSRDCNGCWAITVGSGKKIMQTKRLIFRVFPMGGSFIETDESIDTTKANSLLTTIGGPAFTLLFTIILFWIQTIIPVEALATNLYNGRQLLLIVRNYNLFLFFFTIIPCKYPGFLSKAPQSDGMTILKILRNKQL